MGVPVVSLEMLLAQVAFLARAAMVNFESVTLIIAPVRVIDRAVTPGIEINDI